jgi:hypothetical protein
MPISSESSKLLKLDLMFTLNQTPRLTTFIDNLATTLAHKTTNGHCLVHGELLPEGETETSLLWFHIDQNDDDKRQKVLFCHFTFVPQPSTPAPAYIIAHREKGLTVDSFLRDLSQESGEDSVYVLFDAELRLSRKSRARKGALGVSAAPVQLGSNTLEICGAEYRAKGDPGSGVTELRWSDKTTGFRKFWIHYGIKWGWSLPWHEEKQRCLTYIKEIP